MKDTISIIIPRYKPKKEIFRRVKKYLKENATEVEVIEVVGSKGLANAYNAGIKKAKGEIIITLHQDCIPLDKEGIKKLVKPFEDQRVVLAFGWIMEEDVGKKYYPFVPDGKFTAYRKSALNLVGLFDEKTFVIGGEDADIYYKLKNIGKIAKIDTGLLHVHPGYKTNKTTEKIKQNGSMAGALFRVWGFKYSKWFKAIIWCLVYPTSYGREFVRAFFLRKQDYRRKADDQII